MNVQKIIISCLFILIFPVTMSSGERIRMPVFAGTWYPKDETELTATLKSYIEDAKVESVGGEVIGLICPHAGYIYSGKVAAHAYRTLKGKSYDVVVLVGPSHRYPFKGASVYSQGSWVSPLGVLKIEESVAKSILDHDETIRDIEAAHVKEHSLELQLPFIIEMLGQVPIVPIVMGEQDLENVRIVAEAIASALRGKKGLIIASSDLSHYHDGATADKMDARLIDFVKAMDTKGLMDELRKGSIEACGGGPIAVALMASRELGADRVKILKHTNSGDVTNDYGSVVGYLAAVLYRSERNKEGNSPGWQGSVINSDDQEYLHEIVRETIRAALEGTEPLYEKRESKALHERRGAFVTLKIDGKLRGCMGQLVPAGSLIEVVKAMAIAAAFKDPRFRPVTKEEFELLEIEISVLTPLELIHDPNNVKVGTHGIYIRKGFNSGVLLPQVATEQGWNRVEFLDATCRKAGLPEGTWREEGTEIYTFSAQVF